jgi:hypothetical protein
VPDGAKDYIPLHLQHRRMSVDVSFVSQSYSNDDLQRPNAVAALPTMTDDNRIDDEHKDAVVMLKRTRRVAEAGGDSKQVVVKIGQ